MKKVRMKVLKTFTRNLGGQILAGNPDHPDEDGRILNVTEAVATVLEEDGDAKRYSFKDEAREELEGEQDDEHEEDDDDADDGADGGADGGVADVEAADTTGTGVKTSAQKTREKRVAAAKPATSRRRPKPPVGGNETTATTNHGSTSTDGTGQTSDTNNGANSAPSDEAP